MTPPDLVDKPIPSSVPALAHSEGWTASRSPHAWFTGLYSPVETARAGGRADAELGAAFADRDPALADLDLSLDPEALPREPFGAGDGWVDPILGRRVIGNGPVVDLVARF
jgi:hypothetical protein